MEPNARLRSAPDRAGSAPGPCERGAIPCPAVAVESLAGARRPPSARSPARLPSLRCLAGGAWVGGPKSPCCRPLATSRSFGEAFQPGVLATTQSNPCWGRGESGNIRSTGSAYGLARMAFRAGCGLGMGRSEGTISDSKRWGSRSRSGVDEDL
jgi:hypothetical protein